MKNNQRLELTWMGKGDEIKAEPRILLYDKENSYGDQATHNMLIHGDNLLALKALEQEYAGQVKCIYIDPPYNTGAAFEHYDDNLEHSIWLNLMKNRIDVLYNLLSETGTLWISIDNTEGHYLKIICDEVFGRNNFIADITYEKSNVSGLGQGGLIFNTGEKILVYKKNEANFNQVLGTEILELKTMKRYKNVLVNEGEKVLVKEFAAASNGLPVKVFKHQNYEVASISLRDFSNREDEIRTQFLESFEKLFRTYVIQKENEFQNMLMSEMEKDSLYSIEYTPNRGKNKDQYTTLHYYKAELCAWLKDTAFIENNQIVKTTRLSNVWKNDDIPKADLGNEGGVTFPRSKKPEKLLERILLMATNPGDLVLDSFLGSGTTAAVAHKMGRRYIGIELGEHCYTHCKPRLERIIDGTDEGGISKSANWQGGGGFKFFELAPSLLKKDCFDNFIVDKEHYNADMLAAAVAKINGYRYNPDPNCFWKQGSSTEHSYIYVTTQFMTAKQLDALAKELPFEDNLLICCPAFDVGMDKRYDNIVVRKIPKSILEKCEYGKDNYNLNIVDVSEFEEEECDE